MNTLLRATLLSAATFLLLTVAQFEQHRAGEADPRMVFSSTRDGNFNLYTLTPGADDLQQITRGPAWKTSLTLNLNGRWLLTVSDAQTNALHIQSLDGDERHFVTDRYLVEYPHHWLPAERWLYFHVSTGFPEIDIYRVQIGRDGRPRYLQRLTDAAGVDHLLGLTPDRQHLLISSNRTGDYDLYLSDLAGGNTRNLTNTPGGADVALSFSPDAEWLLFESGRHMDRQLLRTRLDGSTPPQPLVASGGDEAFLALSPDEEWLIYRRPVKGLFAVRHDGTDDQPLVDWDGFHQFVAISPDGRNVVVETAVDDRRRYYRVPFGENGPRPAEAVLLDEALGVADFRAWSPDEDWLFFRAHARDGNAEIYRMNLWDGRLHNLTQHPEADRFVDFSPDGEWVIIESQRAGPPEIYRLPVEGGPFENLTHSGAVTRFLMWWPGVTMDWSGDGLLLLGLAMGAGGVGLSAFRYRR